MVLIGRIIRVVALASSVTLFLGCPHLGSPDVAPGTSNYPEKSIGPIRSVLIHGTVAPTLTISLSTIYRGKVAAGCYKTTVFSGEIFEGQTNPLQVIVPIPVSRDGDTFSAAIEVDRFVPGKCGWHLAAVIVQVSNGKLSFGPATIVQPPDYKSGESKRLNSSDEPVILRCHDLGQEGGYSCKPPYPNKLSQILVDSTTTVNVEIYDDDRR